MKELALFLGISHVSVFKRIQAARIDGSLIALFPDYEGMPPNSSSTAGCPNFRSTVERPFSFLQM